jgi:hypothetical protein
MVMIECPVCHESFALELAVIYLNDRYCSEI